jgi:uncharacterized protein YraI
MRRTLRLAVPVALCAAALLLGTTVLAASVIATPRCDGLKLRTGPSTSKAQVTQVDTGTKLTVTGEVHGSAWSSLCGSRTYSGSTWSVISAIDGVAVQEAFGVDAVYAAAGLLKVLGPAPTDSASPTPPPATSPPPTAAPSVAPTAPPPTPQPTASPTPAASPPASAAASAAPTASLSTAGPAGPTGGGGDDSATTSTVALVLAVISTILSAILIWDRWRKRTITKLPPSRLDDVRS